MPDDSLPMIEIPDFPSNGTGDAGDVVAESTEAETAEKK
jgi:hypothetical protein